MINLFFVLATQNPIEQEGTYPLPEAQLDRFMFNLIDYPELQDEISIIKQTTASDTLEPKKIITKKEILAFQELVLRVPVADNVIEYADLVASTRPVKRQRNLLINLLSERIRKANFNFMQKPAILNGNPFCKC